MKLLLLSLLVIMSTATTQAQQKKGQQKDPAPAAEAPKEGVKHVDAAGAKKIIDAAAVQKDSGVVVLDIRTAEEYKGGHIAGAVNVDFNGSKFSEEVAKLDKKKTYVVHCASGGRSTRSLDTFKKLGFQNIVHLDGGIAAWKAAKMPVTK